MLKLYSYTNRIVMMDNNNLHRDDTCLESMRPFRWEDIRHSSGDDIRPRKILSYFRSTRVWAHYFILFVRKTCAPMIFLSPQRLPQISHHQQGERHMQLGIGLIPSKVFTFIARLFNGRLLRIMQGFKGMSRDSHSKHEAQGYDYSLHSSILSQNLRLSRGLYGAATY